jgi:outer membrane lipoprotein LolB
VRREFRPRAFSRACLAAVTLFALEACRTLPAPSISPWPEQRAALQAMTRYQFRGRLAAATATEAFSASVSWQQQGAASDARLRAPFGVGGARLHFDGAELQMIANNGDALGGAAAHAAMIELLGFEPPLASLRYWLLGVPDPRSPGAEALDGAQHLSQLTQGDWQISYGEYVRLGKHWLPGLVTLRRASARLKVHINHWQLP